MDFGIFCSLYHVLILFLQIKKYIHTPYIYLHPLKSYIMLIVKLKCNLQNCMTYKTRHVRGNYHFGMLINPINPRPKPNSGGGVGIQTDSEILSLFCFSVRLLHWSPVDCPPLWCLLADLTPNHLTSWNAVWGTLIRNISWPCEMVH